MFIATDNGIVGGSTAPSTAPTPTPVRMPFPPTISGFVLYGEMESEQFRLQSEAMAKRLWMQAQAVPGKDHFDVVLDADFPGLVNALLATHERAMVKRAPKP